MLDESHAIHYFYEFTGSVQKYLLKYKPDLTDNDLIIHFWYGSTHDTNFYLVKAKYQEFNQCTTQQIDAMIDIGDPRFEVIVSDIDAYFGDLCGNECGIDERDIAECLSDDEILENPEWTREMLNVLRDKYGPQIYFQKEGEDEEDDNEDKGEALQT